MYLSLSLSDSTPYQWDSMGLSWTAKLREIRRTMENMGKRSKTIAQQKHFFCVFL